MDHSLKRNFNNAFQEGKATNMIYFKKRNDMGTANKNKSCLLLSLDEPIEQINLQFPSNEE